LAKRLVKQLVFPHKGNALKDTPKPGSLSTGAVTQPEQIRSEHALGSSSTTIIAEQVGRNAFLEAAADLSAHLFAEGDHDIPGVSYAVAYRLAELHTGGDIVDVYHFDNDSVALSIADISGKGRQAAIHAALIKFGLRAYASLGLTPEKVMRAMDRLYLENSAFENVESFASVFLGVVDPSRRRMTYASAGHEPVFVMSPNSSPQILSPTAPLIGVFDDQHHLFHEAFADIEAGTVFVAATDGLIETRNSAGDFFGFDQLIESARKNRDAEPKAIIDAVLENATTFNGGVWRDDVAILVARFL
jgi:serine phosphatase RsbU (regulator of sigma subunit)